MYKVESPLSIFSLSISLLISLTTSLSLSTNIRHHHHLGRPTISGDPPSPR
ncbi:hypothetical protein HanPI659440_Chr02g0087911 [Helianthus annuus]|nr:hypothetical protein HanPI659440_Chr02g0087911 [Helianthus annuus]